ncbi:hypothetical protein [Prauserella oleivorans]|uniref:hypothetical protein n=1 Tax=Prauserella oleivorans TaxID=1478153 RepID=UPI00361A7FCC
MDERDLKELFRAAPGDPPPAAFDVGDVTAASRRATARRRALVAGVAAAVVVLGGGAAGVGVLLGDDGGGDSVTAARKDESTSAGQPRGSEGRLPNAQNFPEAEPKQGGSVDGESTHGCDKVDRELATALAGELPAPAADASPGEVCPAHARSVAFRMDGAIVTAVLAPPGTALELPRQPEGSRIVERRTASGGTLVLVRTPVTGSVTMAHPADLDRIASVLAGRF